MYGVAMGAEIIIIKVTKRPFPQQNKARDSISTAIQITDKRMADLHMVAISRPDAEMLQCAMAVSHAKYGQKSGNELMNAGLIIMGEPCAELYNEEKPHDEVNSSSVSMGISFRVGTAWVTKAHEVVSDTVNNDS